MEMSEFISADKTTIIIQINPQEAKDSAKYVDGQEEGGTKHNAGLKGFFKAQPKALGTVQIMTGVVVFLLGIVLTINYRFLNIFIISGINFWGSLIYISAGSLSVAAQNKLHPCVVKGSLGMNLFSAITAGIAIVLASLDLAFRPPFYQDNQPCISGIIGILLVFYILQFIISICISAFACKATCNTEPTVVNVALSQRY